MALKKATGSKYSSMTAQNSIQFNEKQHWTAREGQKQSRCKKSGGQTPHICKMYKLPLYPECMESFHRKQKRFYLHFIEKSEGDFLYCQKKVEKELILTL